MEILKMSKNNKLILFDWGHVIQDGDSMEFTIDEARKKVCVDMQPVDFSKLLEIFELDEFWTLSGNEFEDFVNGKLKEAGSKCNFENFKKSYLFHNEKVPYFEKTIQLINQLLCSNFCLGVLSNINDLDIIQFGEHLDLDKFEYLFFSALLGVEKPNEKIYDIVLNKTNKLPNDILFIDDRVDNIEVAKKKGFRTCLATGREVDKIEKEIMNFIK